MYINGLVTIITPAYNAAKYIPRLFDSVLKQTYPHVEMYVVDDGSTDNTKDVVELYVPMFEEKGYKLHYKYQENAGQNAAINRALKWVDGEYLLYPDSDDWYKTEDAIEIMVKTLSQYDDEVGIARCQFEYIDVDTMEVIKQTSFYPCDVPRDLFEDAFYGINGFRYAPIEYILKVKFLDQFISNREIFINRLIGQNYQILLPYLANSKCVTIDKILCNYLVRKDSHSHSRMKYEDAIHAREAGLNCLKYTLSTIEAIDNRKKEKMLHDKQITLCVDCMVLSIEYARTRDFRKYYSQAEQLQIPLSRGYHRMWLWTYIFPLMSYKWIQKVLRRSRKFIKKN